MQLQSKTQLQFVWDTLKTKWLRRTKKKKKKGGAFGKAKPGQRNTEKVEKAEVLVLTSDE